MKSENENLSIQQDKHQSNEQHPNKQTQQNLKNNLNNNLLNTNIIDVFETSDTGNNNNSNQNSNHNNQSLDAFFSEKPPIYDITNFSASCKVNSSGPHCGNSKHPTALPSETNDLLNKNNCTQPSTNTPTVSTHATSTSESPQQTTSTIEVVHHSNHQPTNIKKISIQRPSCGHKSLPRQQHGGSHKQRQQDEDKYNYLAFYKDLNNIDAINSLNKKILAHEGKIKSREGLSVMGTYETKSHKSEHKNNKQRLSGSVNELDRTPFGPSSSGSCSFKMSEFKRGWIFCRILNKNKTRPI